MDAMKRLYPIKNKSKKIDINLIVIRTDLNGNLKNSKPCFKCIQYMERLNKITIYKIKYVYYSNEFGNVTMLKFKELYDDEDKHVSVRFKKRNQ